MIHFPDVVQRSLDMRRSATVGWLAALRFCLWGVTVVGFAAEPGEPVTRAQTVVVWISVDGLCGDYLDAAETPLLDQLVREGASTRFLAPVFPSLTFPSHVSQATGTDVAGHGIIANALYDLQGDRKWNYPGLNSLIRSEPIWTTAKRQGRRVAVVDWPVSQKQEGEHAADYFSEAYDTALSDAARLQRLWDVWEQDSEVESLRLLMGYIPLVDKAGHRYGPEAPETMAAVEEADRLLARGLERAQQLVERKHGPEATLVFIVSTDHGMAPLHTLVHLPGLADASLTEDMRYFVSGSVAHVYLDYVEPKAKRAALAGQLVTTLRRHSFLHAYRREELPVEWGYAAPGRTGDVVVSLAPGYLFVDQPGPPIRPVDAASGPLGMHGYPVDSSPAMYGFLGIWRSGPGWGGIDLGHVDARRLHATVAQLLDIRPSPAALAEPLPLAIPATSHPRH
jgi:hypothetical protein